MHKIIVKPLAESDIEEAALWYNDKVEGLGNEFLLVLEAKLNAIKRNPNQFQIIYKHIRRAVFERFPYVIFYIIEDNIVYVIAVVHTSRNPKLWKKRK